ncbi:MAG TPA: RNA polymerase sigma factor [Aliidongia sp.]|uniref:RNA polymerase sigma factor n=1 Tax=Aliidongia sp. TaxID=1914230 RepID=UPI002DDD9166|nr:RNA polymerase sigma factor [Aliidongia sp.]HEV2677023.1 RNA polymerase sigma factor [Aliidongia sp.]
MQRRPAPGLALSNLDEIELVRQALLRDEAAFRTIMQRHNSQLYRVARSVLRSDSEAEDVVQETYVRAFIHLGTFRGESSLGTWLARIALNEALGRQRRERPTVEWTALEEALNGKVVPFPHATRDNPERSMAQQEIQRLVERAIDDLPVKYRAILMTRVIAGMNVEDTAALLQLSIETVKTRLHRARGLLRARVERQIGPLALDAFPFAGRRCARLVEAVLKRLDFPR